MVSIVRVEVSVESNQRREVPATVEELCTLLAEHDSGGIKIAITGGATLHGIGFPPAGSETVLNTTALRRILAYSPADMTIAIQGGATLKSLATRLRQHGQFVPFDAPKLGHATVGGTLAAGWLGPRRHKYGRPRDLLIGSVIALADGTLAHAGGMVVKNVAGYDMSRLYVGSFGTLGVLVQANLKTLPLSRVARAFVAPLPEATRKRAIAQLQALAIEPSAALWIEGFRTATEGEDGLEGRIFVLFEGDAGLLERATRDLRSALGRAGVPQTRIMDDRARDALDRLIDTYISSVAKRSITYRIQASRESVEARAIVARDHVRRFALKADLIADIMNGDIILRASHRDVRDLTLKLQVLDDTLHENEPQARIIAGEHPVRAGLRVWGADPPTIDRMRALKEHFDPKGTLNQGRFVGGL